MGVKPGFLGRYLSRNQVGSRLEVRTADYEVDSAVTQTIGEAVKQQSFLSYGPVSGP